MSTTPGPSNDWYVFNLYQPPEVKSSASITFLFSDDPIVALQGDAERTRTDRQINALRNKPMDAAPVLGLERDLAYRSYIVHRLWPRDVQPLGTTSSRAVDAQERTQQIRSVLSQLGESQDLSGQDLQHAIEQGLLNKAGIQEDQQRLFLFNVIVALEWTPTAAYLERLKWAFRQMSDLLYDITNGTMAFGQVIFGDSTWLDGSDIQIMASNRLLPRSWVSGLLEDRKHMPIRAGRGIWNKRTRVSIQWDDYEAFSALVHEWAHYALNQKDGYLGTLSVTAERDSPQVLVEALPQDGLTKIVVPQYRAASDSIMATPSGSSELSLSDLQAINPNPGADPAAQYYPYLRIPERLAGPNRLPLPLPAFHCVGELANPLAQPNYRILPPEDNRLNNTSCWIYVIKTRPEPRVIAQGTFEAAQDNAANGFELLGADEGDIVLIIGERFNDGAREPIGWRGRCPVSDRRAAARIEWESFQPARLPPITIQPDVVPVAARDGRARNVGGQAAVEGKQAGPHVKIKVLQRLAEGRAALNGAEPYQVFPLGAQAPLGVEVANQFVDAPSLDGHILITQDDQPVMVNPYSQGGGPASAPNVTTNPITAGSADGEVLLFFNSQDALEEIQRQPEGERDELKKAFDAMNARVRIVTTTLPSHKFEAPAGTALSHAFAIVGSHSIPNDLYATLVILMDPGQIEPNNNVFIYRLSDGQQLSTYVPPDKAFAAAPLNQNTAPNLIRVRGDIPANQPNGAQNPYVEYFALYAVKRQPQTEPEDDRPTDAGAYSTTSAEGADLTNAVAPGSTDQAPNSDSQAEQTT